MIRRLGLLLNIVLILASVGCIELIEESAVTPLPTLTPSVTPPLLAPTSTPEPTNVPSTASALGSPAPTPTIEGLIIEYLVASPDSVGPNEAFQLFWSAQGGASAAIVRLNDDGSSGRTWAVDMEGSLEVTSRDGGDETFILSVTDGISTIEESVVVSVSCPIGWFFAPAPDGCPDSSAITSRAETQLFERGRMFWFEETGQIIVLFQVPPNEISEDNPAWLRFTDNYDPVEDPLEDEGITPPEGLLEPQAQFGKVWRENPEEVRERIGWALGPASGYEPALLQTGEVEGGNQLYFSDETTSIFRLLPDGAGWQVVGRLQ